MHPPPPLDFCVIWLIKTKYDYFSLYVPIKGFNNFFLSEISLSYQCIGYITNFEQNWSQWKIYLSLLWLVIPNTLECLTLGCNNMQWQGFLPSHKVPPSVIEHNVIWDHAFITVFIFKIFIKLKYPTLEVGKMVAKMALNSKHHLCKLLNVVWKQKSAEQNTRMQLYDCWVSVLPTYLVQLKPQWPDISWWGTEGVFQFPLTVAVLSSHYLC